MAKTTQLRDVKQAQKIFLMGHDKLSDMFPSEIEEQRSTIFVTSTFGIVLILNLVIMFISRIEE